MIDIVLVKENEIQELSDFSTAIEKEHYDPIIGAAQNDYMLNLFQSVEGFKKAIEKGSKVYWVNVDGKRAGYFSIYPRDGKMYLSKFYLHKDFRGKGISKEMLSFIKSEARKLNLPSIFLNVNKHNYGSIKAYEHLGLKKIRDEVTDIGSGFFMDDYIYETSSEQ